MAVHGGCGDCSEYSGLRLDGLLLGLIYMALLQNGSLFNAEPTIRSGGVDLSAAVVTWNRGGRIHNMYFGDALFSTAYGTPTEYTIQTAWVPPITPGGLSSTGQVLKGSGAVTAGDLKKGQAVTAIGVYALSGAGYVKTTSNLIGISSLLAQSSAGHALTGAGYVSAAYLVGLKQLATTHISGSGYVKTTSNLTGSAALISDTSRISGSGNIAVSKLYMGIPVSADISGNGDASAALTGTSALHADGIHALSGSGGVTYASLIGIVQLASSHIAGGGSITYGALGLIMFITAHLSGAGYIKNTSALSGLAKMSAELIGSGTVHVADLKMGLYIAALLAGDGTLVDTSDLTGTAWMSAAIRIGALPSAKDNADAILGALASAYNEPGTIGQKINSAASAGDPWSTELPNGYAGSQAGKLLTELATQASLNTVAAKTNLIPANPAAVGDAMTLTPEERQAILTALLTTVDTIESGVDVRAALRALLATFAGVATGGGTAHQIFYNPAGSAPRVDMTVDVDGNRSSVGILG